MGHGWDDVRGDGWDDARPAGSQPGAGRLVRIPAAGVMLEAELSIPERPAGVVMIAPGVGAARRRPHIRATQGGLADEGWASVLVELLTPREERLDERALQLRLDLGLLAGRIAGVLDWLCGQRDLCGLPVGLLGAGRGAAAALLTAARRPEIVGAVVTRGLRAGLGGDTLSRVTAPTLLISTDQGSTVREVTQRTADGLGGRHDLCVVTDAEHRLLEPGPLNQVLSLTCDWFTRHLAPPAGSPFPG